MEGQLENEIESSSKRLLADHVLHRSGMTADEMDKSARGTLEFAKYDNNPTLEQ